MGDRLSSPSLGGGTTDAWIEFRHESLNCICFPIQTQLGHWSRQLQDPAQVVTRNILANFGWPLSYFMFYLLKPIFWKVRHSWCHMVHLLKMSDENCWNHKTLAEEDMLGHITRLASACHGATVVVRFFQRFGLFLALHWDNLIRRQAETPS